MTQLYMRTKSGGEIKIAATGIIRDYRKTQYVQCYFLLPVAYQAPRMVAQFVRASKLFKKQTEAANDE